MVGYRGVFDVCRPSSEVEHIHGKDGVTGSIPVGGSINILIQLWHRPDHELVEKWHCKSHVPMSRAINHSLLNEFRANRPKAIDFYAESLGNVSGTVCTRTQASHCSHISFFARCEPVETNSEKVLI